MHLKNCFEQEYRFDSAKGGIMIPAFLAANGKRLACPAKVDPGAEYCLFARNYADRLGLDLECGYRLSLGTLTTPFIAYGHNVSLETLNVALEVMVFFPESYEINRNLLGRNGWLQHVKLGLVDYEEMLYLSRYTPTA